MFKKLLTSVQSFSRKDPVIAEDSSHWDVFSKGTQVDSDATTLNDDVTVQAASSLSLKCPKGKHCWSGNFDDSEDVIAQAASSPSLTCPKGKYRKKRTYQNDSRSRRVDLSSLSLTCSGQKDCKHHDAETGKRLKKAERQLAKILLEKELLLEYELQIFRRTFPAFDHTIDHTIKKVPSRPTHPRHQRGQPLQRYATTTTTATAYPIC
mmetsp:Transcript_45548/g.81473  ORF Transcript_45548/g.81473 Transcript_45548/m.81473 type:complete len:208 (-) Transcript_45548:110-733(-)